MKSFLEGDIEQQPADSSLQSFSKVYRINKRSHAGRWLAGLLFVLAIALFLPWTQNIRARGTVTTLRQEQRPQELHAMIPGRVVKWNVKEGDFVKKGDTILQLGEVKVEYFDPALLERTQAQINARQMSIQGFMSKAGTADVQTGALSEGRMLKLQSLDNKIMQQQLKVTSDSAEWVAATNELTVYTRQQEAARVMLDSGAISLADYERRKLNYQQALAKRTASANKLLASKQELTNLAIEKNSTVQDYTDKIAKAEGDKYASLSSASLSEAELAKLQNLYSNYDIRNKLFYITAPQDGQIVQAKRAGIGEMVKEGEMIVEIVPTDIQYAVELFVEPMDLPLVNIGQNVRFVFDGFPAIVFSGWPENSYGTFGGKVIAVETFVSDNGKFRVLVTEDPNDKKWPSNLRLGGGANGIALLKNVPVYYELWRNINGFPPDYYKQEPATEHKKGTGK